MKKYLLLEVVGIVFFIILAKYSPNLHRLNIPIVDIISSILFVGLMLVDTLILPALIILSYKDIVSPPKKNAKQVPQTLNYPKLVILFLIGAVLYCIPVYILPRFFPNVTETQMNWLAIILVGIFSYFPLIRRWVARV